MEGTRGHQSVDHRAEEGPVADGWLDRNQTGEVALGRVTR